MELCSALPCPTVSIQCLVAVFQRPPLKEDSSSPGQPHRSELGLGSFSLPLPLTPPFHAIFLILFLNCEPVTWFFSSQPGSAGGFPLLASPIAQDRLCWLGRWFSSIARGDCDFLVTAEYIVPRGMGIFIVVKWAKLLRIEPEPTKGSRAEDSGSAVTCHVDLGERSCTALLGNSEEFILLMNGAKLFPRGSMDWKIQWGVGVGGTWAPYAWGVGNGCKGGWWGGNVVLGVRAGEDLRTLCMHVWGCPQWGHSEHRFCRH